MCNKCHYDGNVIIFKSRNYSHDFINKINTNVPSFDNKFYICKTCNAFKSITPAMLWSMASS